RQVGANVPDLSRRLRLTLKELEARLQQRGEPIEIKPAYDESDYVNQSVALVKQNLLLGGVLATGVLLLFLGSLRTVGVCAISIPTTIITVFLLLYFLHQTLNILTLAGLAFAVGMVIDNAIVVIENVFTKLEEGIKPVRAAIEGTQEVAGALLASTLTTVAVFTPLVMVEGEAGRVFRALGLTLASSVGLSLISAVTLVPMLSGFILNRDEVDLHCEAGGLTGMAARASRWFRVYQKKLVDFLQSTAEWSLGEEHQGRRWSVLGGCAALLVLAFLLLPPADYLPQGNRNLIFWLMEPYPGTSIPEAEELVQNPKRVLESMPMVGDYFLVYGRFRGIGVKLKPEYANGTNLQATVGKLMPMGFGFPGFRFCFPIRLPIFQNPGKEFEVRIVGPDLEKLAQLDGQITGELRQTPGVVNVRSDYVFGAPELRVVPDQARLAEVGLDAAELAATVEAALGGRFASEFVDGKETLDVVVELEGVSVESPSDLRQLVLNTPRGGRVQVQDVAEVVDTTGPDRINHVNLERSITQTVTIDRAAPLGATVEAAENKVIAPLRAQLPRGYRVYISGSADQLASTLSQLLSVFVFSLLITYLLLMALYRSFVYPFVIMTTVPLGLMGAVICLVLGIRLTGGGVALDMITAIGFVILTGVVVNNAILLVDRALQLQRQGVEYFESLRQATRDRLRPILMSAGTSVLGMLPLAAIPGEGAELYQGLGVVLVGGLTLSTILTPTVVPALMGLLYDFGLRYKDDDPLVNEDL
ncbi:MAG: efflux RND transporter permease subunit, partial [Candidatus Eremiobacteraeota bacterium]|nr:efflux RND transporter permease subunit [Candidatus Eremiobacteraeota bacterium]